MAELHLLPQELELDCPTIFGIASNVKAYKLAWQICQLRQFAVTKEEAATNYSNQGEHICYLLREQDEDGVIALVKNKGTEGYYYKKYKDIDYLVFSIAPELPITSETIQRFRGLNGVSLLLELESPSAQEQLNFIQMI